MTAKKTTKKTKRVWVIPFGFTCELPKTKTKSAKQARDKVEAILMDELSALKKRLAKRGILDISDLTLGRAFTDDSNVDN